MSSAADVPSAVVHRLAMLARTQPSGSFAPTDPDDGFAARCAGLWMDAVERGRSLGADEPSALSIECRAGAVVAVREDDRLLVGVAAAGVSPSVVRYELARRLGE
jgi:hypothetical protein